MNVRTIVNAEVTKLASISLVRTLVKMLVELMPNAKPLTMVSLILANISFNLISNNKA